MPKFKNAKVAIFLNILDILDIVDIFDNLDILDIPDTLDILEWRESFPKFIFIYSRVYFASPHVLCKRTESEA